MIYYLYDSNGYATGKTVDAETKPDNGFEFSPGEARKGYSVWFDGAGWVYVPDFQSKDISFDMAAQMATDTLSNIRYIDDNAQHYSQAEIDTFDAQYQEALVIQADAKADAGPYLKAIAAATGESVTSIAAKVVEKRTATDASKATFAAQLQVLRNKITEAKTAADLPKYVELQALMK